MIAPCAKLFIIQAEWLNNESESCFFFSLGDKKKDQSKKEHGDEGNRMKNDKSWWAMWQLIKWGCRFNECWLDSYERCVSSMFVKF